jgi:hypothetical protein
LRKTILYSSFIALFILAGMSASGQIIKGTVIAGGNLTQVEGDETKGWRQFGFNGGLGAIIPFGENRNWGFNLEALFSQKGSYQKAAFDDSITNEYRLRLNYFEVPLYFTYTDKDIVSVGLGGYFSRLVSYKEFDNRGNNYPYSEYPEFHDMDLGFLIDARVRIWDHLHFAVRYSQTIGFIRKMTFYPTTGAPIERKQLNQSIGFRFIYIFNEGSRAGEPSAQ